MCVGINCGNYLRLGVTVFVYHQLGYFQVQTIMVSNQYYKSSTRKGLSCVLL